MATVPFREGEITFEEFLDIVPDGQQADLLDGVIFMASPDSTTDNKLNVWLCTVMNGFVDATDAGTVYVSRVAYRIGPKRGPEPDLSFLSKDQESTRRRGYIAGPPKVAVEIVSADSLYRDYVQKRGMYEAAGVLEYWIVDPHKRKATILNLVRGRYRERKPVRSIWKSKAVPGFWLDVRWLWDENRPKAYDVLRQLLG